MTIKGIVQKAKPTQGTPNKTKTQYLNIIDSLHATTNRKSTQAQLLSIQRKIMT